MDTYQDMKSGRCFEELFILDIVIPLVSALNIPLFPLEIFLLPGEQLPLHIFEPRYQQLFDEAEHLNTQFGLPYFDKKRKIWFASMCRLLRVTKRFKGGERDVIVEATEVVKLQDHQPVFEGKLYPGGVMGSTVPSVGTQPAPIELVSLFADCIEYKFGKRPEYSALRHYTISDVAASTAMSSEEKLRYLHCENDQARQQFMENILNYLLLLYRQEARSEDGIILN